MKRRKFIKGSLVTGASLLIMKDLFARPEEQEYGHNGMRYRMDIKWGVLGDKYPVNDCHEMVQDSKGNIILLTNETKNNILVYNLI